MNKRKSPEGFKEALKLFKEAAQHVPAYKSFLKRHKINPSKIRTNNDFKKIPLVNKKGYVLRHSWKDIFPNKKVPPMLYASSGSSGVPTFWFRGDEQERAGGDAHERILRDIFKINKNDPTLVVVCFSMGLWVAGNYTLSSLREVSRRGYNLTTVTPGIEKEDIFDVVRNAATRFKNVIFAGYPPFLMYVFNFFQKEGIKMPLNTKIITAGDKFSEKWRDAMLKIIKAGDILGSVISIYGSADTMVMGHETPLSIAIRKSADKNLTLRRKLFGNNSDVLPALMQYDPEKVFFEEADGELVLTTSTAAPLVRYNIHDVGRVLPHGDMVKLLRAQKNIKISGKLLKRWRGPFLFIKNRTDVAATFYALNIFPEHVAASIADRGVKRFFSGNFVVYNKNTADEREERLYINLELAPRIRASKIIRNKAQKSIVENLCKLSIEYRKLFSAIGEHAIPVIKLYTYGHRDFMNALPGRALVRMEGKKPRIILNS